MSTIKHWLFRVGPDASNLYACSKHNIWGVNSSNSNARKFVREANQGDIIWFVKGASKGLLISYATYVQSIKRVKGENMTDEELGWFYQCPWVKNQGWDIEIQFENYSDVENMGLLSQIQQSANPRLYSEKCMVNLPRVYQEFNVLVPEEEALVQDEHEDEDKEKISIELQNIRDVCSNIISSLSRLDELLNLD
jgi:hypothetical protein